MRAAALALWALAGAAQAAPAVYVLDPEHSFVFFEVQHFGTSTLRGRFGAIRGTVELDAAAAGGRVELQLDTASVSTGVAAFDARLREADLLGSESWPQAQFVATQFRFDGPRVASVRGTLTLRGYSQALELRALQFGCHTHPALQREVCGGDFEGELRRADFGAGFGIPFIANRVRLLVQAEGIRR